MPLAKAAVWSQNFHDTKGDHLGKTNLFTNGRDDHDHSDRSLHRIQ
jgi:hypothetical protein